MHPRSQLTPEEHGSIRNWSFAMAIIYFSFIVTFLALAIATTSPAPPDANMTATGMRQKAFRTMQSPNEQQSPTEATTQQ
jgi:hypothetical protein